MRMARIMNSDLHELGDRPYNSDYYEALSHEAAHSALKLRPADAPDDWLPSIDQVLSCARSEVGDTWYPITDSEAEDAIRWLAVWIASDGQPFSWEWHPQAFASAEFCRQRVRTRISFNGWFKSPLAIGVRVELSVAPDARDRAETALGGDPYRSGKDLPWADDSGTFCAVVYVPRQSSFASYLAVLNDMISRVLRYREKISYNVLSVQIGRQLHQRLYRRPVKPSYPA